MLPEMLQVGRSQTFSIVEHYQCQQVPNATQLQNQDLNGLSEVHQPDQDKDS